MTAVLARLATAARSVRTRAAVGAAVVMTTAFGALTWYTSTTFDNVLADSIVDEAVNANTQIVADLAGGVNPGSVPWTPGAYLTWRITTREGTTTGVVTATSPDRPSLVADIDSGDYRVGTSGDTVEVITVSTIDGEPVTVAVSATSIGWGVLSKSWTRIIAAATPFVLGGTVVGVWWVVGRAFAPVDRMRRSAAVIGESSGRGARIDAGGNDDELGALAETLNAMLDRLEAASDTQRRFISDAGHELRTPIATLTALIATPAAIDDRRREQLRASIDRLAELTDSLFVLAVLDEWGLTRLDDIDLDATCEHAIESVAVAEHLRVETNLDVVRICGDEPALRRSVVNLVANATRWAMSTICVSCGVDGDVAYVTVEDDGPGVPPADRERIFTRFARSEDSRGRDSGGAGLGLSIVARTAAAHGGTATVGVSELGGARFEIRVPINCEPELHTSWADNEPHDSDDHG